MIENGPGHPRGDDLIDLPLQTARRTVSPVILRVTNLSRVSTCGIKGGQGLLLHRHFLDLVYRRLPGISLISRSSVQVSGAGKVQFTRKIDFVRNSYNSTVSQ